MQQAITIKQYINTMKKTLDIYFVNDDLKLHFVQYKVAKQVITFNSQRIQPCCQILLSRPSFIWRGHLPPLQLQMGKVSASCCQKNESSLSKTCPYNLHLGECLQISYNIRKWGASLLLWISEPSLCIMVSQFFPFAFLWLRVIQLTK